MNSSLKAFVVTIAVVVATSVSADTVTCKDCDPQVQDGAKSHREQIKEDRAKYDRENEKILARPWDVIKDEKTAAGKK
jgi:hypothetical protein